MKRLSDILGSTMDSKEVLLAARAQRAMRDWENIVGPLLAEKTVPERFDHGTVWVSSSGSAWAQELRLRKETILQRLDEAAGEPGLFRDIRVGTRNRNRLKSGD